MALLLQLPHLLSLFLLHSPGLKGVSPSHRLPRRPDMVQTMTM
jgi:hypothetical protein